MVAIPLGATQVVSAGGLLREITRNQTPLLPRVPSSLRAVDSILAPILLALHTSTCARAPTVIAAIRAISTTMQLVDRQSTSVKLSLFAIVFIVQLHVLLKLVRLSLQTFCGIVEVSLQTSQSGLLLLDFLFQVSNLAFTSLDGSSVPLDRIHLFPDLSIRGVGGHSVS